MLLLVFFVERLTNHQSFIGADYIHNSHSHLTGILFPIASPCHTPFIIRFFFLVFLLITIELKRCRFYVFRTAVVIQKHAVGHPSRVIHVVVKDW